MSAIHYPPGVFLRVERRAEVKRVFGRPVFCGGSARGHKMWAGQNLVGIGGRVWETTQCAVARGPRRP